MDIRRKVIIDTDIGDDIDDAFAILLAIYSKKFEILGLTTVFRNAEHRAKIARTLTDCAGVEIPVYVGADTPVDGNVFVFPFETLDENGKPNIPHYYSEMGGVCTESMSAEDFILAMADKYPNEVCVIALGPFTNIANAIRKDPEKFGKIQEVLMMGGERHCNFAEWNVRCDCESAKILFDADVKMTVCGFDITSCSQLSAEELTLVRSLQGKPFRLLVKMMEKYITDNKTRIPTMHDPVALCFLLREELFETENKRLSVSLENGTRGRLYSTENGRERVVVTSANIPEIIRYMLGLFVAEDKRLLATV